MFSTNVKLLTDIGGMSGTSTPRLICNRILVAVCVVGVQLEIQMEMKTFTSE